MSFKREERGEVRETDHEGCSDHFPCKPPAMEGTLGANGRDHIVETEIHETLAVPCTVNCMSDVISFIS